MLLDMNLSPDWVPVLQRHGLDAIHWSTVGDPRAPDRDIMDWALNQGYVVFTHDLDFGALLAATRATGPSVIQVRTQDVSPDHLETIIVGLLNQHEPVLNSGALIVVDDRLCQ